MSNHHIGALPPSGDIVQRRLAYFWVELVDEMNSLCYLTTNDRTTYFHAVMDRVGRYLGRDIRFRSKFLGCGFVALQDEEIENKVVQVTKPISLCRV